MFISVNKSDLEDLILYADTCAGILEENDYSGEAEALRQRALKIHDDLRLDLKSVDLDDL